MIAIASFTKAETPVLTILALPTAPREADKKQKIEPPTLAKKGLRVIILSIFCLLPCSSSPLPEL